MCLTVFIIKTDNFKSLLILFLVIHYHSSHQRSFWWMVIYLLYSLVDISVIFLEHPLAMHHFYRSCFTDCFDSLKGDRIII